jgi:hypothetical protein
VAQPTMMWEGLVHAEGTPPYMLRGNMRGTSAWEHSACTARSWAQHAGYQPLAKN